MENLKINILSKEEIEEIHKATMKVLADPGILVDSQEARDLFKKNGCEVDDETKMVKIPESVVKKALSTVPKEFVLYSRDGKHNVQFKSDGSVVNNNTFGIGTKIIEYAGNGQYIDRESTLKDLGDIAKVADYCDNIDFFCSPVSAMDLADDPVRTLKEMKALLVNSVKPIDLDSDSEFFEEYFEMVAACYGGDKERAKREPINTVGCCPASPLQLDAELCATALTGPKYGFPLSMTSMVMASASGPIYSAGTLVIHNAEVLTALMLAQLNKPGCKVIYSQATTIFDFINASAPIGAPEIGMFASACAKLAQHYHIPCMVAGCTSDAKKPGVQSGLEKAMTCLTSCLGGSSTVFGAGMIDLGNSYSKEQLLIDNEIIKMVRQIRRGIKVNDETIDLEEIRGVGIGNDFLGQMSTLANIDSLSNPKFLERGQYGDWVKAGCPDAADLAHEMVVEILSKPPLNPIEDEKRAKIDAILAAKRKELEAAQ